MTVMHKHHIVPRYRCEELGIDPDFEENIVEVTREQHALIHWGYQCSDLEPLLEVCDPSPEILEMIAFGDTRDSGAAVLLAQGEIDGINTRGENNPNYKHGLWGNKEYNNKKNAKWREKHRDNIRERHKEWCVNNPEKKKASQKKYYDNNKQKWKISNKKWREENREKRNEYQRQYRAKKKAEKLDQQTGATLPL